MYCRWLKAGCMVLLVLCWVRIGSADEIRMKNGDRISGEVITLKDDTVTFKTSYAGTLTIKWGEIEKLNTDVPVCVGLKDKTLVNAKIGDGQDGKLTLDMTDLSQALEVNISDVAVINPGPPPPAVAISGHVDVGFSKADGNTETQSLSSDGEFVARSDTNRFTLMWIHLQSKVAESRTADNTTGSMKYDHFFYKKWYALANLTLAQDAFKDLNFRTDMGLGVGHQVWESTRRNLSFELGLSYANEDNDVAPDDDYMAGRWGVDFTHLIGTAGLQFFHNHHGFIGLEDNDDMIVRTLTGFRLPLYKRFVSSLKVKWDWEKAPAPGKENSDINYLFTLGFQY